MTLLRWLGSWSGWLMVMAFALSIHVTGDVAYRAGERAAAQPKPSQVFADALMRVLAR